MELNFLIVTILDRLLDSDGSLSIAEMEQQLGVSRRVLDYNVRKLNHALAQGGFPQVASTEKHLLLNVERGAEMQAYLQAQPLGEYILSVQEREVLIVSSAGLLGRQNTADDLCRLMNVSRNTVLGDMTLLRKRLVQAGVLKLQSAVSK